MAQFKLAEAHYRAAVLRAFPDVEDACRSLRPLADETRSLYAAVTAAQQTETMTTTL